MWSEWGWVAIARQRPVGTAVLWRSCCDQAFLLQRIDQRFGLVLLGRVNNDQAAGRGRLVGVARLLGEKQYLLVAVTDVQQEEHQVVGADRGEESAGCAMSVIGNGNRGAHACSSSPMVGINPDLIGIACWRTSNSPSAIASGRSSYSSEMTISMAYSSSTVDAAAPYSAAWAARSCHQRHIPDLVGLADRLPGSRKAPDGEYIARPQRPFGAGDVLG